MRHHSTNSRWFSTLSFGTCSPPSQYRSEVTAEIAPFGRVLAEALSQLAVGDSSSVGKLNHEQYAVARSKLMASESIDIDFKKMVDKYWETFFAERIHESLRDQTRGEALQWFAGEGNLKTYRSQFGVHKMVSRESAKVLLQSLAGFAQLAGYRGLLILFDEAEQSYSVMRKADLKEAHNNLLSIISNIEHSLGLFMIYATTPDFFDEPQYGIVKYPALASRIGMPKDRPPTALQNIWSLDAVEIGPHDYESAAMKIRDLYIEANPKPELEYPGESEVKNFVREIFKKTGRTRRSTFLEGHGAHVDSSSG